MKASVALLVAAIAGVAAGAAEKVAFEFVSVDKIDVALHPGQTLTETITVRSTGTDPIKDLVVAQATLADSVTTNRVVLARQSLGGCVGTCALQIELPRPLYAGAYTGSLSVIADNVARQNLAIVIRTRGPNRIPGLGSQRPSLAYLPRLPFVLFWLVTLIGCALSLLVDAWFAGGGRRRVQTRLLLAKVRSVIISSLARAAAWQAPRRPVLSINATRWQLDLGQIEDLEAGADEAAIDDYEKAVNKVGLHADASKVLLRSVDVATDKIASLDTLAAVVRKLDAIDPDAGTLADYTRACLDVLKEAGKGEGERGASLTAAADAISVPRLKRLRMRLVVMDWLYVLLGWIVIGLVAYLTFFDRAWSFGTVHDYITLFLWTLGLTQTGSQILARSKSSYART